LTGATTLRRAFIYDFVVGADGTPADNAMSVKLDRQTTVGTATAAVPAPLDTQDAAALITANVNHTAEPTVTSATQLVEMGFNQRSGIRWVAPPGGELVVPATTTTGVGLRVLSPVYTGTVLATIHFFE
jgi:hypothetical protein